MEWSLVSAIQSLLPNVTSEQGFLISDHEKKYKNCQYLHLAFDFDASLVWVKETDLLNLFRTSDQT